MTAPTRQREFWVIEFNHPTFGWCIVGYPIASHVLAQGEIAYRLRGIAEEERRQAALAYRIVQYVPGPNAAESQP